MYIEKEQKRQERYDKKIKELSKKELKERREVVTVTVQKHRLSQKQTFDSSVVSSSPIPDPRTPSPLTFSMSFLSRGEPTRKRKHRSNDRLCQRIAKLE